MKTRCLKCGEEQQDWTVHDQSKKENPTCINCNAKGHMAFSTECPLFPKPKKGVEATLVALTPSDQEPFLVASIYAQPNPMYRNLGADLDAIFKIFKTAFLAGDFNAKHISWGCVNSDPRDDTTILGRHRNLNTLIENINEHLAHLEILFSVWKIALFEIDCLGNLGQPE
ncbi:hypothetical protein TNCV_1962321 [Trichonephila clavipes]|nr:hypothetical protein TNCV_1962321 [Trichonephila clavipes]